MQYVLPVDPQLLAAVRTDCASRRPQVEQSFTENKTTHDDTELPAVTRTTFDNESHRLIFRPLIAGLLTLACKQVLPLKWRAVEYRGLVTSFETRLSQHKRSQSQCLLVKHLLPFLEKKFPQNSQLIYQASKK